MVSDNTDPDPREPERRQRGRREPGPKRTAPEPTRSEPTWQRARSSDKKEQRVTAILDAAADLFARRPYDAITTEEIARGVGFTRPNLYRYFRSKEEIFLTLVDIDLTRWIDDLEQELQPAEYRDQAEALAEFVERWCRTLFRQERLLSLLPLMSLSLERNVSEANLLSFKQSLRANTERIGVAVSRTLPRLRGEAFTDFLNVNLALVAGLGPMSRRSELQERVLSRPELEHFKVDFERQFRRALRAQLRGSLADSTQA